MCYKLQLNIIPFCAQNQLTKLYFHETNIFINSWPLHNGAFQGQRKQTNKLEKNVHEHGMVKNLTWQEAEHNLAI